MFLGHFAVGFAAKRVAPRTSLGILVLSTLFLDVLWPVFLLLGCEHAVISPGDTAFTPLDFVSYPWSHSLLMATVWAAVLAGGYYAVRRYRAGATVLFLGVLSHWVLDAVTHRPDLPLSPGASPVVGFELWRSIAGTVAVEVLMFAAGVWVYARATQAADRIGRWAWWSLVALLAALYAATARGAVPPSITAVAWTGLGGAIVLPLWSAWADRHRIAVGHGRG